MKLIITTDKSEALGQDVYLVDVVFFARIVDFIAEMESLNRATELRNEAEAGEHTCPSCAGTGITHSGMKFFNCAECNGTGQV